LQRGDSYGADSIEIRGRCDFELRGAVSIDALLRDLAQGCDRRGIANELAIRDRGRVLCEHQPGLRPIVGLERAEVDAVTVARLGRQHCGHLLAGSSVLPCSSGDFRNVVAQPHPAKHRLGPVAGAVSARTLFAPLGPTYDRYAALLSFGQDPRWRRFLVSRVDVSQQETVLDVATGTGAVARELLEQKGCVVVGLDQSPEMLAEARRRLPATVTLVEGHAEQLPFGDGSFDGLTFTYLLRYVEDPAATLRELTRVLRPGAPIAGLEFALPRGVWHPLWELYVRVGLPLAGRVISPAGEITRPASGKPTRT